MKLKLLLPLAVMMILALGSSRAAEKKGAASEPEFKIHPKVFSYVEGWLSDGESPVVTEINLDAVKLSTNQFQTDEIKEEDGWIRAKGDGDGFRRYRVIEHKGNHYKIEYQDNGGGSLTTSAMIEFSVEKREVRVDGKPRTVHVLRVLSYANKP
jgi:hypothetical protein